MKKKFDNRGFSLVELLIAVAILAIVVAPLLHSFVTSANTAAKSRELGEVTLAAQNVAEIINATDMDAINLLGGGSTLGGFGVSDFTATNTVAGVTSTHTDESSTAGSYSFSLAGLSGGKYTAEVKLDAEEEYSSANSTEITQYTSMDAVFNQSSGTDPDEASKADFQLHAAAVTDIKEGTTPTVSYSRKITLNIIESDDDSCSYSCIYAYTCKYCYISSNTGTLETLTWTNSYETPFGGGPVKADNTLPSIYFFFNSYGYYDDSEATDEIEIIHTGTTPVSVVVACQGATYPISAKAHIRLKDELYMSEKSLGTKVFCNIPSGSYLFYIFENNIWYISTTYSESLYDTKQENRIYTLEVSICKTGDSEALYTLNTTKLD